MNITPAPYCKRCRFYHGADKVVCGLHPYGPDSEVCSDYDSRTIGPDKGPANRYIYNTRQYQDAKYWQSVLVLGLLLGAIGIGGLQGWLVIHRLDPPTKPAPEVDGLDKLRFFATSR